MEDPFSGKMQFPPEDRQQPSPKNTKKFAAPVERKPQGQLKPDRHTKKFTPPVQQGPRAGRAAEFNVPAAARPVSEQPVRNEGDNLQKKKKSTLLTILFIVLAVILTAAIGLLLFFLLRNKVEPEPAPGEEVVSPSPSEETTVSTEPPATSTASPIVTIPTVTPTPAPVESGLPKLGDREVTSAEMVKKGDILTFGVYEQDGNVDNGREPLKWRVLKKNDTRLLLITDQIIDSMAFNDTKQAARWKDCSLRRWLNGVFIERTFSKEEQNLILSMSHEDNGNDFYYVGGGDPTIDRVFLLDIGEAFNLFSSDQERTVDPTRYALTQGVRNEYGHGWWWLRNPGVQISAAAVIAYGGSIYQMGENINTDNIGVRPAIWIEIPIE